MIDHFRFAAPVYDRLLGSPDHRLIARLLRLPARGMLLDAGGGTGRGSTHLRDQVEGLVVSDPSRPMLARAIQKNLWAVSALAECLPFHDESFERILVVDALHHFCHQETAVTEFARILKPGGRLLIEEPDIRRIAVRAVALAERLLLMESRFYPPSSIIEMMHKSGFSAHIAATHLLRVWITGDKPRRNSGAQALKG